MKTVDYSQMFDHLYGACILGTFIKYRIGIKYQILNNYINTYSIKAKFL